MVFGLSSGCENEAQGREFRNVLATRDSGIVRDRRAEVTDVAKAKRGTARKRTNRLSAAGRRAISLAAKRRWAKYRAKRKKK